MTQDSRPRQAMAATELAIILPLLLTLVLGCIDFGRFTFTWNAVTSAAQAGASVACTNPYTPATQNRWQAAIGATVVEDLAAVYGFNEQDLTVTITPTLQDGSLREVTVQVQLPFHTMTSWPGFPSQMSLTRTVVLRVIRP